MRKIRTYLWLGSLGAKLHGCHSDKENSPPQAETRLGMTYWITHTKTSVNVIN